MPIYSAWQQQPAFEHHGVELRVDGTSGARWSKIQTFAEFGAGIYPSATPSACGCAWAHAVDGDNGSDNAGVSTCPTVTINGGRTGLGSPVYNSSSTYSVGDTETWSNPSSIAADYSVSAYQGVNTANPNRFGLDPRVDYPWPTPPLPPVYDGWEYESTQATIVSFQARVAVTTAAAVTDGFTVQVRTGTETGTVVFTPPAFLDHATTAGLALLGSLTVAAGTASGASVGTIIVDLTSSYVPITQAYFPLLISTDRLASLLTPDGAPGSSPSGSYSNLAAVTVDWVFTILPPRWRSWVNGIPPLRMYQRRDGIAGDGPRQWKASSLQATERSSWPGSYL